MERKIDIDKLDNLKCQLGTAQKLLNYLIEKDYTYNYFSQKNKDFYYQIARAQELYIDTQNILDVVYDKISSVSEDLEYLVKRDNIEVI